MKRCILFPVLMSLISPLAAQYSVRGGSGAPLLADKNTSNRIEVYMLYGLSGAQISFTSSNPGTHEWYRYRESGANAVPIDFEQEGNTSYITDVQDGYGYFVKEPDEILSDYVWIIDYSLYVPRFFELKAVEADDKCTSLQISADVEAEPLIYYLPSGAPVNLSRFFQLQYDTQEWLENDKLFIPKEVSMPWNSPLSETAIDAPLMNTFFTLTGDQFAEHFRVPQTILSEEYRAIAVEAHRTAETTKIHADNELHPSGDIMGGSAPVEYTFTAYANEPVAASYIWKISQYDSTANEMRTIVRYTDKVLQYNFERDGIYRVELEVSDAQSVCVNIPDPYEVIINSTVVKIPNVFSPGSSIGVNDELRVAFTSVISFKASVYNRQGNLLFQWSDPAKGWDGRVNGKYVPTGAYAVVVEYKDSNGKSKVASRMVNVLRAKN